MRKAAVDAAVEQPHFEGRGVQRLDGQERDGKQADLRAQLTDGLAAPEQPEIPVTSEGSLGHRRTITRGGRPAVPLWEVGRRFCVVRRRGQAVVTSASKRASVSSMSRRVFFE